MAIFLNSAHILTWLNNDDKRKIMSVKITINIKLSMQEIFNLTITIWLFQSDSNFRTLHKSWDDGQHDNTGTRESLQCKLYGYSLWSNKHISQQLFVLADSEFWQLDWNPSRDLMQFCPHKYLNTNVRHRQPLWRKLYHVIQVQELKIIEYW